VVALGSSSETTINGASAQWSAELPAPTPTPPATGASSSYTARSALLVQSTVLVHFQERPHSNAASSVQPPCGLAWLCDGWSDGGTDALTVERGALVLASMACASPRRAAPVHWRGWRVNGHDLAPRRQPSGCGARARHEPKPHPSSADNRLRTGTVFDALSGGGRLQPPSYSSVHEGTSPRSEPVVSSEHPPRDMVRSR
jgi:hypothetical protein